MLLQYLPIFKTSKFCIASHHNGLMCLEKSWRWRACSIPIVAQRSVHRDMAYEHARGKIGMTVLGNARLKNLDLACERCYPSSREERKKLPAAATVLQPRHYRYAVAARILHTHFPCSVLRNTISSQNFDDPTRQPSYCSTTKSGKVVCQNCTALPFFRGRACGFGLQHVVV